MSSLIARFLFEFHFLLNGTQSHRCVTAYLSVCLMKNMLAASSLGQLLE